MTTYAPMAPGITVYGSTIRVFVEAITSFAVLREAMLEVLGVDDVDPEHWFPQENILKAYQKVDYVLGGRGLERFGRLVPTKAVFPPGIHDVHSLLAKVDATYHLNHRRDGAPMIDLATGELTPGIGHYLYERVGEREALLTCDNPYPCRFDMGLYQGFITRFEPNVTITHEPGECRSRGDERCVYRARW